MADLPGGASGLLVRGYKGKEADRLVTRIDPGVVALVAELRPHERQAAQDWAREDAHRGASRDRRLAGGDPRRSVAFRQHDYLNPQTTFITIQISLKTKRVSNSIPRIVNEANEVTTIGHLPISLDIDNELIPHFLRT